MSYFRSSLLLVNVLAAAALIIAHGARRHTSFAFHASDGSGSINAPTPPTREAGSVNGAENTSLPEPPRAPDVDIAAFGVHMATDQLWTQARGAFTRDLALTGDICRIFNIPPHLKADIDRSVNQLLHELRRQEQLEVVEQSGNLDRHRIPAYPEETAAFVAAVTQVFKDRLDPDAADLLIALMKQSRQVLYCASEKLVEIRFLSGGESADGVPAHVGVVVTAHDSTGEAISAQNFALQRNTDPQVADEYGILDYTLSLADLQASFFKALD